MSDTIHHADLGMLGQANPVVVNKVDLIPTHYPPPPPLYPRVHQPSMSSKPEVMMEHLGVDDPSSVREPSDVKESLGVSSPTGQANQHQLVVNSSCLHAAPPIPPREPLLVCKKDERNLRTEPWNSFSNNSNFDNWRTTDSSKTDITGTSQHPTLPPLLFPRTGIDVSGRAAPHRTLVGNFDHSSGLHVSEQSKSHNLKDNLSDTHMVNLLPCLGDHRASVRDSHGDQRGQDTREPTHVSLGDHSVISLSHWPIPIIQPDAHLSLSHAGGKPLVVGNEYVDSPSHLMQHGSHSTNPVTSISHVTTAAPGNSTTAVIVHQPVGVGSKPTRKADEHDDEGSKCVQPARSCKTMICSRCHKCRCAQCTRPRQLPHCWIGPAGHKCECSVYQAIRHCTCLCCVQGLFYHCLYHPDDDDDISTDPCACCEKPRCCLRWTVMAMLVPCLPCLCCYCPLQCINDICTSCYNACSANAGCRCGNGNSTSSGSSSTTRDLLLDSESSSA